MNTSYRPNSLAWRINDRAGRLFVHPWLWLLIVMTGCGLVCIAVLLVAPLFF